jgi:hydroxymethylbilane synthase
MISPKRIRIGTRESALALYQANEVQRQLNQHGIETALVEITSDGDNDLTTPLYEMGIQGIFTKSLDVALLNNQIDVAVHSCKDIPTKLANGLVLSAVLKRASQYDCIVFPSLREPTDFSQDCTIATSSLRRRTQWLHRYPQHITENLRGNIQTRLKKLDESGWHGAIFAEAALERLKISSHKFLTLDWMLPSPAQGAIAIVSRQEDEGTNEICKAIDHHQTNLCISAERDFLAALHGGCAVPIAAHAVVNNGEMLFKGNIFSLDAKQKCEVEMSFDLNLTADVGNLAARKILQQGADAIIKTFRVS